MMTEEFLTFVLLRVADKLYEEKERYSYRNCLISVLCGHKATLETAEIIAETGRLGCNTIDMNIAIAVRNNLSYRDIILFNTAEKIQKVISKLDTEEPLNVIGSEVKEFLLASRVLVEEIKSLLNENKTKDKNDSILSLFDKETEQIVEKILTDSFSCMKFYFDSELLFTRKDNSSFIHTVEKPMLPDETLAGFSDRPYIRDGAGIFYEYNKADIYSYVTTNVARDLSVAYINEDGVIVEIVDRSANDDQIYCNKYPAQFVLEITQGWFKENNITVGDSITENALIKKIKFPES